MPSLASALYLGRAVLPAVVLVDSDDIAGYGVVRALGLGMRDCPIVRGPGHAGHGRDGVFSGVGADGGYFRANIGAACFETPASMRSLLFSRSSSSGRSSSGVLAAASVVTPASPRHLIHRESVGLPRSYSAISSPLGLPARQGCAICRLNSSVNFLGWLGSAIAGPFSGGSSVPLRTV